MGVLCRVNCISLLENYVQKMEIFLIEGQLHQEKEEERKNLPNIFVIAFSSS